MPAGAARGGVGVHAAGAPAAAHVTSQRLVEPAFAEPIPCARVDSNHHGPFGPQGPQPCASTNSATSAERASISLGPFAQRSPLIPSRGSATVRTHVRFRTLSTRHGSRAYMDLTKRQQEIFDFIRKYSAKYG